MTHRDPTFDAVATMEEQTCLGCRWHEWNPFSRVAWCEHPKWTGREEQRPSSKPIGPLALRLHRCTDFDDGEDAR